MQLLNYIFREMSSKIGIVLICLCFRPAFSLKPKYDDMKPCPKIFSKFTDSVDRLLGNWHIVLLIMDETNEIYEERSICIAGRLSKINSTSLIQTWDLQIPQLLHQEHSEIDFPTTIIEPGMWLVQSPLGGEILGTVLESDGESYLLMVYCGGQVQNMFHMMTMAMSRNKIVTPKEKLLFLSLLRKNGFDFFTNRIVSWSNC